MNEVIRQLAARKSVRAFEDRDIPGEVRAAILEAAAQAPTAGNQQLYTILDVTDPAAQGRGWPRRATISRSSRRRRWC